MENNIKNKEKFFVQYWGQNVFKVSSNATVTQVLDAYFMQHHLFEDSILQLKPLSSILGEDAIEVGVILMQERYIIIDRDNQKISLRKNGFNLELWFDGEFLFDDDFGSQLPLERLQAYDYLRSKEFALPWNGVSVKEQIERGWIKLIE